MDAYSREKKKQFGQNFLIDVGYIHQIVSLLSPQKGDMIIEIGPGTGALTEILLKHAEVLAVEIDHDLITFLQKRFEANARFRLLAADVLTLAQQDYGDNRFRWFGNLPYNISTPFLLSLLDKLPIIKDGLFMVQYEVAMRMIADPATKDYGRLSVILQRYFDMDSVLVVPPEAFDPPPKVMSAVVRMLPKKGMQKDSVFDDLFSRVVCRAFSQRRKMLRKVFASILSPEDWNIIGIDALQRSENLYISDFEVLTSYIQRKEIDKDKI